MICRPSILFFLLLSAPLNFVLAQANDSNPDLALGIEAYKSSKYEEAIQHFDRAVVGEPTNVSARLYLANSYAQQFIPGMTEPNNMQIGDRAIEQYQKVLELDSANLGAIRGIVVLCIQMKQFDKAKEYGRKAIEIDPQDPESYYSIGIVDWTQTYQPRMEQRARLNLRPEQSMTFAAECWTVRHANWERVADGIEMLKKAINLRRDYDDAMAYMNLMYRERADIQCGDPHAREADLKLADSWVDMTLAVKKQKEAKDEAEQRRKLKEGQQGNITVEYSTAPNPQ